MMSEQRRLEGEEFDRVAATIRWVEPKDYGVGLYHDAAPKRRGSLTAQTREDLRKRAMTNGGKAGAETQRRERAARKLAAALESMGEAA